MNVQRKFVGLKQIRCQAKSEASTVFAGITENDLQFLDEEVDLSTSFPFVDDMVPENSNSRDNQQNNLLNISNPQENNSSSCDEPCLSSDGLNNSNNNDYMEIDDVIEDGVIRVRHDLFNTSNNSDSSTSETSDADAEVDGISQKLRLWNVQYNITRDACRALLQILKPLQPELPLDPRTLNQTPRKAAVQNLRNGSYAHVGLISGLQKRVESGLKIDGNMRIGIDVNIDGINMTKSTITDVWPILCRSLDLKDSRPFVVGFFVGTGKPDPLEDYLRSFIEETLQLFNDTLTVGEKKKYAIADLEVTVGDEKHLDVCVIAHNWISEDSENCLYPTYLAPKKQAIATKTCMEPTAKFNSYPATVRAWFVTYEEARRKLERAVDKTDLDSDVNRDKANRGLRKRKYFTDLSSSEDETDKYSTKVGKSDSASQKGNSLVLPTFTFSPLPEENLPVSSESQSISGQTKENGNLDSGSIKNDITNYKSSTVLISNDVSKISKTMTTLPSKSSLNDNQPGCSNSKKEYKQGNKKFLNISQSSFDSTRSKKELNGSRSSLNVSKSSTNKKKQFSQDKDRNDKGTGSKFEKSVKKHFDVNKYKNRKENKDRTEKATTDKSQRSVLGIADINEKIENNVLMLSPLESVRSPSNSNSNDFLITAKGGNNIYTNFEKTDPRATSSPREHDITYDSFSEDDAKDSDHSRKPFFNDDSTSSNSSIETATTNRMCVKQIDKLSPIQVIKLQYEKLCVIEKTNTKLQTTVEEVRQLLLNRTEVLRQPKGLPSLPFATFEDIKIAEDLANRNSSIKDYIIKKLMFASSGKCEKDCSKKVMALLMTNHTGTFFNWKGGKGKQPFGSWHLKETVISAVTKLRRDGLDIGKAENGIKEWLKERGFRKNT